MKPVEIYQAPYLSEQKDLYPIKYFLNGINIYNEGIEKQDQVELRTHYNPYIDGTRNASLYSVWFQNHPVMICKTGGRPDYEHYARYITDKDRFHSMLYYLKNLELTSCLEEDEDIFNVDQEIEDLNIVYCHTITSKDLGPIAHARSWIARFLEEWSSENAWPYLSYPNEKLTLQDKQAIRWLRIQEEVKNLLEEDPASIKIAELILKNTQGNDEIIKEALKILESLE